MILKKYVFNVDLPQQDLGLDAETDVRVLVLCWKLKSAEKPGEIKKEEFLAGMREMGVDSKAALKAKVHTVR
jgi:hypothetical protein